MISKDDKHLNGLLLKFSSGLHAVSQLAFKALNMFSRDTFRLGKRMYVCIHKKRITERWIESEYFSSFAFLCLICAGVTLIQSHKMLLIPHKLVELTLAANWTTRQVLIYLHRLRSSFSSSLFFFFPLHTEYVVMRDIICSWTSALLPT